MRYLIIVLVLLLPTCSSPVPVPEDHFYRLPATTAVSQASFRVDVLQVEPFQVSGLLRERPVVFMQREDSVELRRYNYHLWYESLDYMLQQHLADYLRQANAATNVTTSSSALPDIIIRGELFEFMHIRDTSAGGSVVVEIELMLRSRRDRDVYWQGLYQEQEAVVGVGMDEVVAAFGRALNRIYNKFLEQASETIRRRS